MQFQFLQCLSGIVLEPIKFFYLSNHEITSPAGTKQKWIQEYKLCMYVYDVCDIKSDFLPQKLKAIPFLFCKMQNQTNFSLTLRLDGAKAKCIEHEAEPSASSKNNFSLDPKQCKSNTWCHIIALHRVQVVLIS